MEALEQWHPAGPCVPWLEGRGQGHERVLQTGIGMSPAILKSKPRPTGRHGSRADHPFIRSLGDEAEESHGSVGGSPGDAGLDRALGGQDLGGHLGPRPLREVGGGQQAHRDARTIETQP